MHHQTMPPKHPHHPPHHLDRRSPLPQDWVKRLDQDLTVVVPDAADRAFALRCVLQEGPEHHRGANAALLLLLVEACKRAGGPWPPAAGGGRQPRMHLPPHLMETNPDARYPVSIPPAALATVAPDPAVAKRLEDALLDGPPQHAVANTLMVALLDGLLRHAGKAPP